MVADSAAGKKPSSRVVCAEGEHTRCPGDGEGRDPPSALPSTAGYRYADRHRALFGRAVLEDSPSPVYGAALLMRFGSDPIRGSNPRSSARSWVPPVRRAAPHFPAPLANISRGDDPPDPPAVGSADEGAGHLPVRGGFAYLPVVRGIFRGATPGPPGCRLRRQKRWFALLG